jgi:hypothetical protein
VKGGDGFVGVVARQIGERTCLAAAGSDVVVSPFSSEIIQRST